MRTFWIVFKWAVGVAVILALIAGGVGVFLAPSIENWIEASRGGPQGTPVRTLEVERGRLVRTVSAPGELEARQRVQISSRISGQITELPFREGDRVEKGDVVVRLDDRDLQASLNSAQAELRAAEARLEGARASYVNANAEWERQQSLYETNDVSKSALDQAEAELRRTESDLEAAKQNVEAARAEVERIKENLRYAELRSPMNGVVTKLSAEVGEVVITGTMNNPGTVILEIADLSEMLVKVQVDESDIAPVEEGQSARVHINAYPDEVFEGTVRKIALQHSTDSDGSKYYETEVLLHLEEGRRIYSGLTANVEIEVETLEGVVLVPSQGVVEKRVDELPVEIAQAPEVDPDKTFARVVYRLVDGEAVATPVRIGPSDLRQTAVLAGLEPGQRVIVGPWSTLQSIEHGQRCRRMEEELDQAPELAGDGSAEESAGESQPEQKGEGESTASDGGDSDGRAVAADAA